MKNSIFLLLLSICILFPACQPNETDDPEIEIPFLRNKIELDSGNLCIINSPIVYGDYLIVGIENLLDAEGWINCYDKNSLELVWRWREAADTYPGAYGFSSVMYAYDGILCIAQSNLSYGIDITNGQTIWHNRDEFGDGYVRGNKELIADLTYEQWNVDASLRLANIYDGQWDTIYTSTAQLGFQMGFSDPYIFEWNNADYVCFVKTETKQNPFDEINWLHLYNITEEKLEWISDTIPKVDVLGATPLRPIFEDGQILLAGASIFSFNIEDGSLEWSKYYGSNFTFSSHLLVNEGRVYGNNHSGFLVGLDVHSGQEYINVTTAGGNGRIVYHDGKCYIPGAVGTDGYSYFIAVDLEIGELAHKIAAPYWEFFGENSRWFFDFNLAVDPEYGTVFLSDHKFLMALDLE